MTKPLPTSHKRNTDRFPASPTLDEPTLAEQFPGLNSLTVDFELLDASGVIELKRIKFKPNLDKASSQSCLALESPDLSNFDFKLDALVGWALNADQRTITGELSRVHPTRDRLDSGRDPAILRFRITLDF